MKTPRPEHSSWFYVLPSPRSSSPDHSTLQPAFVYLLPSHLHWISPRSRLVPLVPQRLAGFTLSFNSPLSSSLHALHHKSVLTQAGHIRTLHLHLCLFLSPPPHPSQLPSSLTAAKSAGASRCFILLLLFITL